MYRVDPTAFHKFSRALIAALAAGLSIGAATAQELVLTTGMAPGGFPQAKPVIVFPDLGPGLPNPARTYIVPPTSPALSSQGLTLLAPNRALVTQLKSMTAILLDTSTGMPIDSYDLPQPTPTTFYDGYGTLAVNPAKTHVLAVTDVDTLWVIAAPFDHTAAVTMLPLPSSVGTPQTRAIAFDSTSGRAYVALLTGIAVIDPPYTSIAFTIPSSNGLIALPLGPVTGAIALSPDNATLVATRGASGAGYGPEMRIFHAPFTAASVPDVLTIGGASLDGMSFTPDGSKILVVESMQRPSPALPRVYSVASPYGAASNVETLQFETGGPLHDGFEDIDISPDGQLAALAGGSINGDPFVVLKAPFTAAGFTFTLIDVPQFDAPYGAIKGRGEATARFWSTSVPALPPQVWVDFASTGTSIGGGVQVTEGNSGTTDAAVAVNLSGPSTLPVTIDYTTVDGTTVGINVGATAADNDYISASGTLTFAPGETTKNIVVKVVGDTAYEHDERFNVVISNPVNASLLQTIPGSADTGTVVIKNDDAVVPIAITTAALPDGATGVPYSFQLSGTGAHPFTWTVSSFPSVLPAGLSLDSATGIISGTPTTPGTLAEDIKLTDPIGLFAETILNLTITGAGIPVLTVGPNIDFGSRVVGTTSGLRTALIANTGAADLVLGTPFAMIPAGGDFILNNTSCSNGQTLAPGVTCLLDFKFKPQATGIRTLNIDFFSNAPTATLTLTGVGTSGALPVVSIADATSVIEGNSGTTPMTFAVTLTSASASIVTVNYAATGGTATPAFDYTLAGTGTLTFAPGVTTQNITVNVNGDTQVEPDETILITLSSPSGATLGAATATGIILNDDAVPPLLALLSAAPDFGNQVIASTSAPRTVTVGNIGGGNLVLATPFAVLAAGDFGYTSGANGCVAGQTLAAAATCNLYVVFTPSALGSRTASVALSSNAPDVTLVLSGIGVQAALATSQPIPTLSQWALVLLMLFVVAIAGVSQRARTAGRAKE